MMMRTICSLVFGLSLAVVAQAQTGVKQQSPPTPLSDCATSQVNAPIVIWEVTGETLFGSVHGILVVYNSGAASVASARSGDVRTAFVGSTAARMLREDLIRAGATTLCDQGFATDLPLTTVTVLGDRAAAGAYSLSYWHAEAGYAAVQAVIDDFLSTHFSGFAIH